MSGIMVTLIVAGALLAAAVFWVLYDYLNILRSPNELTVKPPDGQTFSNGHQEMHFYLVYGHGFDRLIEEDAFAPEEDNPSNFVWLDVPAKAKLSKITLFLGEDDDPFARIYNKTFWPRAIQLPDSVKNAQAITLQFSVPGDKWGITRHSRLV